MPLQREIAQVVKSRRSKQAFVGGSSVFNERFPRRSDDIDIYAEDVPIGEIAHADIAALMAAGFLVGVNEQFYGFLVEAVVTHPARPGESTKLEWSEADRRRFYPITVNATFGWTLHETDLAVQKLIAAASRRQARDALDLVLLDRAYAPLAALAIAAPAKLESASPIAILERALRHAMEHPIEDYLALRVETAAMPFPIASIKTVLADAINHAIDLIANRCLLANPGFVYLERSDGPPKAPLDADLSRLHKHGITAKGAVPLFSNPYA